MLHAFLTYINEQKLFTPTDKILLTVSGGKDSIVMFDLFCEAKRTTNQFPFAVAHCNFQLRGQDSEDDEIFIKQLCENNNISFHTTRFETKKFTKENHLSTQMAARQLRYEWFEKIRQEFNYDYIATAHHLNDSIETVLLNLTKGTGISGLRGILPKNGHIIRPLLFTSRTEIDDYITAKNLAWKEDSSNASIDYQRNLLRHKVVPLLKQINPNLEQTFARNLERLQSVEIDFQKNLSYFKKAVMRQEEGVIFLKIENIKYWQSAGYLLEELLKDFGFNYFQSKEIHHSLDKLSGKTFHSSTHTLVKDREDLIISMKNSEIIEELLIEQGTKTVEYHGITLKFSITSISNTDQTPFTLPTETKKDKILYLDADKITFPLTLRPWKEGDWFIPLGMKGKKKISDFLIDKKIPLALKKNIFLLTSQNNITWVIGHRTDNRFKITSDTKRILQVELLLTIEVSL